MRSFDFEAVVYEGAVYCTGCLPHGVSVDSEEVSPVFADSEWDYVPTCDACGAEHDYVTVLSEFDEPDHNDEVLCCPDCERPNQFGELCPSCEHEHQQEISR